MKVVHSKNFLKDLANLPAKDRERVERFAFETVTQVSTIFELVKAEKLQGYKHYYKIRLGDYRIGIHYLENTITLERVLNRKEIYRYFP